MFGVGGSAQPPQMWLGLFFDVTAFARVLLCHRTCERVVDLQQPPADSDAHAVSGLAEDAACALGEEGRRQAL